jgi:hypothetical protein
MLNAPTHDIAAFADMVRIMNLVEGLAEDDGEKFRLDGYRRAQKLLEQHRSKVEKLALALADRTELNQFEIDEILIS